MLSLSSIKKKARTWLGDEFNEETRKEVREMLEKDEKKRNLFKISSGSDCFHECAAIAVILMGLSLQCKMGL